MRLLRGQTLLAFGAATVMVVGLLVVDARHTTSSGGPAVVSGKVPVVACPTTRGTAESGPARFGRQLAPAHAIDVPQFSYYTDDARQIAPLLGPRGWRCHVLVAADGGVRVTLAPPLAAINDEPSTAAVRITAQSAPACEGCIYSLLCAYLPTVERGASTDYGRCPEARRRGAHITWLEGSGKSSGPDAVRVDRPRVIRCSSPQSCWHTSLILYRLDPGTGRSASREWCGLTGSAYDLCTSLFDDFTAREWGLT